MRVPAAPVLTAMIVAGCGASNATLPLSASASGSPSPIRALSVGVAVPTCGDPEARPAWWTPSCGDAGYQLESLAYDVWTPTRAVAHGTTRITHGDKAGSTYRMSVIFDRPQQVAAFENRSLFSRAVVTYLDGPGPQGTTTDTFDLSEVWKDSVEFRQP